MSVYLSDDDREPSCRKKTDKQIEMQYKSGADSRGPKEPRIRWKCAAVPSGE